MIAGWRRKSCANADLIRPVMMVKGAASRARDWHLARRVDKQGLALGFRLDGNVPISKPTKGGTLRTGER